MGVQSLVERARVAVRRLPGTGGVWLGSALVFAFVGGPAWADGPRNSLDQADQIRRQRLQYEQREQELERTAPPAPPVEPPAAPLLAPPPSSCFAISRIEVTGVTVVTEDEMAEATAPFAGKCLALADLDHVLDALNGLFIKKGFVLTRAYLPEQDLKSGVLRIVVIEGRIEGGSFKDGDRRGELFMAFPGLAGGPFNLRDAEQGVEQMNRLPGWDAKIALSPGKQAGTSRMEVDAAATPLLSGKIGTNGYGGAQTGHDQGQVDLGLANALGILDALSAEYDRTIDDPGPQHFSDALSARASVPYGYWALLGEYDFSNYHYDVQGVTAKFALRGHTERVSAALNRVLGRTQSSKTSLEAGYEVKRHASFLEDVKLYSQSQDLAAISLRLTYSVNLGGDVWYSTVGLKRGMGAMGTDLKGQPVPVPSSPHAVYDKPSYDLNGFHPFSLGGVAFNWNPAFHYEYATHTLYGSEQLNVGGPFTVRGFHDNSVIGEHGGYLRNDVLLPLPESVLPADGNGAF
ncbi:MAG TPA: ShlB/FhaC/HecB family hemolysin secretion/activation protein, partial [Telmatospirillum sp.]|nr:ShlB/FhaC/HecB family hemolysin secretion/activation protein [Telmatospirillum sp.]